MKTMFFGHKLLNEDRPSKKIRHEDFVKAIKNIYLCTWVDEVDRYLKKKLLEEYGTEHPQTYCYFNYNKVKKSKEMVIVFSKSDGTIIVDAWDYFDENLKILRNMARELKCNIYTWGKMIYKYTEGDEDNMEEVDYERIHKRSLEIYGRNNYGESFGYKIFWYAVETSKTKSVIETLGLKNVEKVGWSEGLEMAYEGDVFVTPPIDGWTLIVSSCLDLPDSIDVNDPAVKLLNKLAKKYSSTASFFGSHRVSNTAVWMYSTGGYLQRLLLVEDGEVKINYGQPFGIEEYWDILDEDAVLEAAEKVSINPMAIETYDNVKKKGYIGEF